MNIYAKGACFYCFTFVNEMLFKNVIVFQKRGLLLSTFFIDTFHLRNPWFQVVKALVSGCKTLGFTT